MSSQTLRQPLTADEHKLYTQIFQSLDPEQLGIVTGETARSTFEKSGLPPAVLGEIWQLADPTNLGFLNQFSFSVALRLIGHVQSGAKLDKSLIEVAGPIARFAGIQSQQTTAHDAASSVSSPPQPLNPQLTALPVLTNHDLSKFTQLFAKSAPSGVISGEQARNIFFKAKLPNPILGQIWNLVDRNNVGQLTKDEFVIAMYLIQNLLNGSIKQLPGSIPQQYWDQVAHFQAPASTGGSLGSAPFVSPQPTTNAQRPTVPRVPSTFTNASSDWSISAQKRQQFDAIFAGLDKESKGVLGPNEVAPFLLTSKLPQDTLAIIWDLSDIHNTGEFTKDEFAIAMFLVQKKIAGVELPAVIPDSLLPEYHGVNQSQPEVQRQQYTDASSSSAPAPAVSKSIPHIPSRDTKPHSSLGDLVDLNDAFSSPAPFTSSSDNQTRNISNSSVKYTPTGTKFVPTSTFGQGLAEKEPEPPVSPPVSTPPVQSVKQQPSFTSNPTGSNTRVPVVIPFVPSVSTGSQSRSAQLPKNNDLLADSDPEVSGQLSKATTDLANLSNQIGSLTNQTSQLHGKRARAEQELLKITNLKRDIESKLANLRVAYDQEVNQTREVENLLKTSTLETEELRKEASLAEAQYNQVQTNLASIQAELEESQKESSLLKEKLGTLNAEQIELQSQLEKAQSEVKQSRGFVAINSKQLDVNNIKSQEIQQEIQSLLSSTRELDTHHEKYLSRQAEIETFAKSLEEKEQGLELRKQQLEQAEAEFAAKEQEFAERAEQQKKNELIIQDQDAKIDRLVAGLQERKNQLDQEEAQLHQQQLDYAERVQAFSYKQIEDVGLGGTSNKSVDVPGVIEQSNELGSSTTESKGAGVSGLAAGTVIGGALGAAAAAVSNTSTTGEPSVSERDNTQFSSPIDANTEQGTSINSEDYQYRTANQFNNLEIERDGSPSSSVQNNAPMSVRDDIEEVEQDQIINTDGHENEEEPATASDVLSKSYNSNLGSVGENSGAGSFELVDDEANSESEATLRGTVNKTTSLNEEANDIESTLPGAWSFNNEVPPVENEVPAVESDFPEIVETAEPVDFGNTPVVAASAALGDDHDEDDLYETPQQLTNKDSAIPFTEGAPETLADQEEEFLPIKELKIDESDSELSDDEFHETNDDFPSPVKGAEPSHTIPGTSAPIAAATLLGGGFVTGQSQSLSDAPPIYDDEFSGLEKAPEEEKTDADFDEFAGLEAAPEDSFADYDDDDGFAVQNDFNQELEGTTFFGTDEGGNPVQQPQEGEDNEEWEQIFAGFGNQGQQPQAQSGIPPPVEQPLQHPQPTHRSMEGSSTSHQKGRIATTPRSLAVQELTGMGFSKEEALNALETEKWNLEAATNFLLDNA
jgi:epidermal growth factor receptor substrate 15